MSTSMSMSLAAAELSAVEETARQCALTRRLANTRLRFQIYLFTLRAGTNIIIIHILFLFHFTPNNTAATTPLLPNKCL